jgi:hypothetical protein
MKATQLFNVALIFLGTRQVFGDEETTEDKLDACGNRIDNLGPPCPIGDPNYGDCNTVDPKLLTGVVSAYTSGDDDGIQTCLTFTPDLSFTLEDGGTCHPSCKSCHKYGVSYSWDDGTMFPGKENNCYGCNDSTEEAIWTDRNSKIVLAWGYCKSSVCATEIAALDKCLTENADLCPTSLEELQNKRIERIDGVEIGGLTEVDGGVDWGFLASKYADLRYQICNPIIGLMEGFTLSEGTHHDCPCSPQLYNQMYCFNPDTIGFLDIDGVTFDGKSINEAFPPTSSNPREEVCSSYARPMCAAIDVPILLGADAEGCLDNSCNILPDCKCNKYCGTCGWWDSLDDVFYYKDDPKQGAGEPGNSCISCKNGVQLSPSWAGTKGSGNCWGSAAPTTHKIFYGAIFSMINFLFLLY